jgi:hypothetical protein
LIQTEYYISMHCVAVANDLSGSCKMILLRCKTAHATIIFGSLISHLFFLGSHMVRKYRPNMALIPY